MAVAHCPKCGFEQPSGGTECLACGVVFAKFAARQREQLKTIQPDVPQLVPSVPPRGRSRRLSSKRTKQVTDALAQLLSSGTSPKEAIRLLAKNSDSATSTALASMAEALNKGGGLSDALATCPHLFSPAEIEIVRAAEQSGHPSTGLYAIASQLEQIGSFRERLLKALMYPLFIVVFSVAVMPLSRLVSGDVGGYLFAVGWRLVGVVALAVVIVRGIPWMFTTTWLGAAIRTRAWRATWPLTIYCAGARSVFCRMLAHNLTAGLASNQAVHGAAAATGDSVVIERAQRCLKSIQSGGSLSAVLVDERLIEPGDRIMLAAGEASGSLAESVKTLGEQYDRMFERGTRGLLTVLGITVTCVVLVLVGLEIYQAYKSLFAYQESIYNGLEQMDGLDALFRGL